MKKFFTKSLLLILLAFGGIHAAYADFKGADSYGHGLQFEKTVLTLDQPYITWSFPTTDEQGTDDIVRYTRMYVGADASGGGYKTFMTAPKVYFEVPYSCGAEILYMDKKAEITQRQNGAWGVANAGSTRNRGCTTDTHTGVLETDIHFYPGENLTPAMLNGGFWVRWTAWWDTDSDGSSKKYPGYWLTEGSAQLKSSADGADWQDKYAGQQKYKGNGLVHWAQITYNIPKTKEVTYVRKPGGVIEAQIAGNDHADWDEYYGFSNSDTKDGNGYYTNSYGKTSALDKGAKGTFTFSGKYDETESYEFYYHQFYKRSVSMSNGNSDGNQTANMHFEAPRIKSTAKGFMYPSNLQLTQNKWNKSVELKWAINNKDSNHNTDGGWLIFRRKEGESGYQLLTNSRLSKDNSSYTDTGLETGAKYTYWVTFAPNSYGTVSEPILTKLTVSSTVQHDKNFGFSNMNADLSDGENGGITISWTPEKTGSDVLFFIQRWDERSGQWLNLKDVGQTGTTYTDNDVQSWKEYKYRIKTSYWGLDFYSMDKTITYALMTKVKEFTASQGTYSNMVKLNWNVTVLSDGDTRFVVSRKLLGDPQAVFKEIYETVGKESAFYYEDLSAQPGQFYDYKVTAFAYVPATETEEAKWAEGNSMEADGFVQTRGILSGRIKYGTGVAVPNVKVVLTKSGDNDNTAKQFYSLYLGGDNASGVQWELSDEMIANYFTGENRPWSIQMYVHPVAGMTGTQSIFDVNGYAGVGVSPVDGGYQLMVKSATGSNAATYSATGIVIPAGEYTHLVFSYDGGSTYTLRAIRPADENENGVVFEEGKTLKTFTGKANVKFDDTNRSRTITFGKSGFMGNIDEMRVWTKVLTDKEVETYHNRTLSCTEKNLLAYWPVDEGINGMLSVYDYSKTNGVANGNHALAQGVVVSEVVPTEEQLSIYSFTDENGNYVIRGVPFSGDGTTYLVRPVLGIHEFNPIYHTRYVSSNTLTHDNIEFEDVSSFKVTGVVYYENTTYPVQGCNLAIDGTTCSKDGQLIETDENGRFEISVPIGDHHITVSKTGHTFTNEGRYPIGVDTKFTFDREVSNLTFYDNTLVNVAGRVVGGDIEGNKPVGFGDSRNNIGVAELVLTPVNDLYSLNVVTVTEGLTSRYENNTDTLACASASDLVNSTSWRGAGEHAGKIYIRTDAKTGEFSAMVPPLIYNVEAPKVINNENKTVGEAGLVDVSNPLLTTEDTLTNVNGDLLIFESHAIYKQVYHSEPNFTVKQIDFENGAFGIASYETTDEIGNFKVDIVNEKGTPVYAYGTPFFIEGDPYTFRLKGYEEYTNYDGDEPVTVTVPLENCVVTISNALSNDQAVVIDAPAEEDIEIGDVLELEENQLALDEKGEAIYTWKAGYANITAPYSRNLSMTYEVGGQVNSWKFNGEEFMPGVILGSLPTGSNFVTQGPDKLLMVLRDPPGSGSNAEWTSGTVTSYEKTIGHCWNTETTIKNTHNFGGEVKISSGSALLGAVSTVTVETAVKDDLSWGGKAVSEGENSTTTSHSLTVTQTVSTSDDPSLVGSLGDVFIGQSTNLIFGKAREVGFHRENGGEPKLDVEEIFTVGSTFSTYFTYTAYYIESYLIPNWEALRNNLLISLSEDEYKSYKNKTGGLKFITKLKPDDPRFGSNNHDKDVWKEQATELGALDGPSYKVVLPERLEEQRELEIGRTYSLDQDTIYQYNLQISNWVRHLAANEEEKVKAWEDREKKLLRNYSFDGGASISYSYETDTTFVESHEHNSGAIAILGNVKGFEVNKAGWELETSTETGGTRHRNTSDTESQVASFSFNLVESGDDALSVDVYNSPYSYIFRTRAGQTSAPYEDEEYTKYYEPGKHKLHEKTMQIEVPDIEVEVPTVSNITSGSAASYTLKLMNKSEIDCDLYYKLLQMDETNPNGAQLSIDGVALSDNRVIKVPAGEVVTKTLLLKQSNLGVLDYKNIGIVLASQEQGDPTGTYPQIADTVYISAYYVPSSSPVKMELSRTLLNTSSGANLDITFNSFDRNYYNLKAFRIQYMKQGDTDWTMLKEYLLNVEEGQQLSSLQMPLPETANVTYTLDMSSFTDGKYTFRVLSASTYGTGESTLVTDAIEVTKDMSRPMAFGTPKPTTGFLGMGDDIEITFNENINNGRLTSTGNFIVTAALNGQQVAHDVALMATGSEGAAAKTEANINLIGKSFAVDMWVRISGEGTIFSHGNGQTKLTLGVKEVEGNYYFCVNGVVCDTEHALPADKWIYLAFSLDQEGKTSKFSALYANDAETIYLAKELPIEKYEGNGVVALGNGFTGAIHEVTLWDAAVDVTNLQAQMHETKMPTTEKLIGYWKFNEGLGTQAKDVARNRHMNLAATSWYLNNQNKALALASDTLYASKYGDGVVIYLAECAARNGDDFAVEMWFCAEKEQDKTLAYLFQTDAFSVVLENSKLSLRADDKVLMSLGNKAYNDDKWHHLAINVLRNGNTIVYIDGEAVGQIASAGVPALQTGYMYLGGKRVEVEEVNDEGQLERHYEMEDKLKVKFDEIRVWNATLNAKVLRDRMYSRLQGNEPGLVAYYPFEEEKLDANMQVVTEGSALDMVTKRHKATGLRNNTYAVICTNEAPALKPVSKESNVNYNFVASERGIVIELNEDADRLEGTTVNITVKDVLDLNGNMSLPITWTALVQRNQLLWFENEVDVVGRIGEEKKFTATVTNQSAQTEYWALNDLPSWLSANFTSGSLPALGTQEITFTVDASAPTGKSEFTVYMSGNNAILVPLTVNMNLRAEAPEWSVDPADFESSATLFGAVKIDVDGKIAFSEDEDDLVAAFIDGKCAGVTHVQYDDYSDSYRAYLTIYGNSDDENKEIKLMVWDASADIIHPVVYVYDDLEIKAESETQLTFSVDGYWGDYDHIYCVYASNDIQQSTPLKKNWNWISVYVQDATGNEVNSVLESINPNGAVIKSADAFSSYLKVTGQWNSVDLSHLAGNSMYKLQMTAADTLVVEGEAYDNNDGVALAAGWNWIPYYRSFSLSLDDAFASVEPARNDQVKGQEGYAMYNGTTWNGTLKSLQPGKGYLYKSASEKTLKYPSQRTVATASLAPTRRMAKESMFAPVDPTEYESNMTILAVVMEGDAILERAQEIAVFDGATCMASAFMESDGYFYLTIPGDKNITDRLTMYVVVDGEVIETSTSFYFDEDATFGNYDAPFAVRIGETTAIDKLLAEGDYVSMQVVDLNGRVLYSGATTDFDENDLHDGQYIFEFFTEDGQIVCYKQMIRRLTE